jgi:phosphate transport system substrate-binding protein
MIRKSIMLLAAAIVFAGAIGTAHAASARDYISIVGSSTVYPFATVVAEKFGKTTGFKTPKIESTGTGGGFKLFCAGVGAEYPDISNASRAIKKSECEACAKNGVTDIVEVRIGYDGIVIANAKKAPLLKLTRKELFLALAKEVPEGTSEKLIANPYKTWKEINATLPADAIEVLGPPPTSGTRDAFVELAMEEGAQEFPWLKALKKADEKKFKSVAQTIREDGAYIEAGENDNLIVQKLEANPKALGIFGYSYLEQNEDKIQGAFVEGVQPTFEAISSGKYSVSRPLFFYVKKAHADVIPGMKEYIKEFASEKAWGPQGYLSEKGLIPMPDAERKQSAENANALKSYSMK